MRAMIDRPAPRSVILTAVLVAAMVAALAVTGLACHSRRPAGGPPVTNPADDATTAPAADGVPGARELPFPASAIEKTWPLSPDRTLIAYRLSERDVTYYLAAGGKCEPIVGAVARAEVRSASAAMIEFVCHGVTDTPFVAFPYLVMYDVATGKSEQQELFADPRQALEFGGWASQGHVLTGLRLAEGALEVQFETAEEALPATGGPISEVPHTVAQWDSARGALVLRFAGTAAAPGAAEQASALSTEALQCATITPTADGGLELGLRLAGPVGYNITYTFGEPRTMTVRLAAQ